MLVLSRVAGQRIMIGPDIIMEVLGVRGHQVRLGFIAHRSVSILREELLIGDSNESQGNHQQGHGKQSLHDGAGSEGQASSGNPEGGGNS